MHDKILLSKDNSYPFLVYKTLMTDLNSRENGVAFPGEFWEDVVVESEPDVATRGRVSILHLVLMVIQRRHKVVIQRTANQYKN